MANNTKSTAKKSNVSTITFSKKTIALIVAALGVLLIFIGLFGDTLVIKMTQAGESLTIGEINLSFIFKDGWDSIAETPSAWFSKVTLIIAIVSFFIAVIGVSAVIAKNLYSLYKKEDIKFTKSLALILIASMQYLAIPRLLFSAGVGQSQTGSFAIKTVYGLGWGSILVTIGFFIVLVGIIISEANEGKLISQSNIALKIGFVLAFFVALFGLASICKQTISSSSSGITHKEYLEYSSFSWYKVVLENESSIENLAGVKVFGIISILFSIVAVIFFMLALYNLVSNDLEKNSKKLIVFSSIYFISELLANIMLTISAGKSISGGGNFSFNFNGTAIAGTVLGALLLVTVIVACVLRNKSLKYVKSK